MSENKKNKTKPPAIGIDLGTTYSCVGVFQYGFIEIVANEFGNKTTPSFVAFTDKCRLIGEAAKNQSALNPDKTVYDAKRLIGRRFDDPSLEEDIKRFFTFETINYGGKPKIKVEVNDGSKLFTAEEISAIVLTKMKEIAEFYLNTTVTDAVITVPAYFNYYQRQATKDAGRIAGLNVLRIINEPTAAAIAYGLDKKEKKGERNVLIFDLGGGTFDVTILGIDDGVFEVKSISGNTHLGGRDFHHRMALHFVNEFSKKHSKIIKNDKRAMRRLENECEKAKITLSAETQATIEIDSFFDGIDFTSTITRAKFEELCIDLFKSTLEPVEKALKYANLSKPAIEDVVLVGGSSRIPKIQRLLQEFFDGKELNRWINPDEVVAYGAAVQASILNGDDAEIFQDLLLLDVVPLSLGIQNKDGQMTTLIKRNTTIPTRETKIFSTTRDNQTSILVEVFEGERPLVKDNKLLGIYQLSGFPPAPSRVPQIEVTFDIDANGILIVSAVEKNTGNENKVTINQSYSNRLSSKEIEKMIQEAQLHQKEDELYQMKVRAQNLLKNYIDQIRKTLNQEPVKSRMTAENTKKIETTFEEALKWLENNDQAQKEQIKQKQKDLETFCQPIIANVFKETAASGTANEGAPNPQFPKPTPRSFGGGRRACPVIVNLEDD